MEKYIQYTRYGEELRYPIKFNAVDDYAAINTTISSYGLQWRKFVRVFKITVINKMDRITEL